MAETDKILVRGLKTQGILGVEDWERHHKQPIHLDLTIHHDLARAGASDDLADSINYRTVAEMVKAYVEASSHLLVESLAEAVARLVLEQPGASRVVVRVEKPAALPFAESVGVEIERCRGDFAGTSESQAD